MPVGSLRSAWFAGLSNALDNMLLLRRHRLHRKGESLARACLCGLCRSTDFESAVCRTGGCPSCIRFSSRCSVCWKLLVPSSHPTAWRSAPPDRDDCMSDMGSSRKGTCNRCIPCQYTYSIYIYIICIYTGCFACLGASRTFVLLAHDTPLCCS